MPAAGARRARCERRVDARGGAACRRGFDLADETFERSLPADAPFRAATLPAVFLEATFFAVFEVFFAAAARGRFAVVAALFFVALRAGTARFRAGRFGAGFAFVRRLRIAIGLRLDRRIAAERAATASLAPRVHWVNTRRGRDCRATPGISGAA
jgi:hypothetical protein